MALQRTVGEPAGFSGPGFLYGREARLRLLPAAPNSGIVFVRTDLPGQPCIPAHPANQRPGSHCTVLGTGEAAVSVVEHLLAACAVLGVSNLRVEIDAPELPTADGSAKPYADILMAAGIVEQDEPAWEYRLARPLLVREDEPDSALLAFPSATPRISYLLHYPQSPEIGCAFLTVSLDDDDLVEQLLPARTFITEAEARSAIASGWLKSTDESLGLVVRSGREPELRMPEEFARHKILDLVGDLHILGKKVRAHYVGVKSGHKLNARLVRELAARYP